MSHLEAIQRYPEAGFLPSCRTDTERTGWISSANPIFARLQSSLVHWSQTNLFCPDPNAHHRVCGLICQFSKVGRNNTSRCSSKLRIKHDHDLKSHCPSHQYPSDYNITINILRYSNRNIKLHLQRLLQRFLDPCIHRLQTNQRRYTDPGEMCCSLLALAIFCRRERYASPLPSQVVNTNQKPGNECYCSSTPPSSGSSLVPNQKDCSTPCTGNTASACGGGYRLSVYAQKLPITSPVSGFGYLGCFVDSSARILGVLKSTSDSLTEAKCANLCKGYKYFGLENGECSLCPFSSGMLLSCKLTETKEMSASAVILWIMVR
jgi:hypothetical protein